jgi:hypothetical protein
MKVLNFAFTRGSHFPAEQAQIVGKFLIELQEKSGTEDLTPQQVLTAARPKTSPIHDYFTWDNQKAAEQQRLAEASYLLRSIQIEYVDLGPERRAGTMRMLVNLRRDPVDDEETPRPSDRVYMSMVTVLQDPHLRRQLLQEALDQAIHWRNRYSHFQELATIFAAIGRVEKELTKRPNR